MRVHNSADEFGKALLKRLATHRVAADEKVDRLANKTVLTLHGPRHDGFLAGLGLGHFPKRHANLHGQVISHALAEFERAVFKPDLARLLGESDRGGKFLLLNGRTYPSMSVFMVCEMWIGVFVSEERGASGLLRLRTLAGHFVPAL